ncbi:MAG TPA: transposase, partial [Terriglobales bacterium]
QYLQQREDRSQGTSLPEEKRKERLKKKKGNKPQFDLRAGLFRMTGVDLTQIDCIDVTTATTILSEAGSDMSKWETEHHFVSWLRLCPDNRIHVALKMAASTLRTSNTYLGAQFRRLKAKLGAPVAIKAMAAKLARLVYRMLRYGMKYVDQGATFYELRHRELQVKQLKSKAAKLGYQIVQAPAA